MAYRQMMKAIDSVIFDLDGTLWDTSASCARAWTSVLNRNQISFRNINAEDVRSVTGKPHEQCIREVFVGLSEKHLQCLIAETAEEDIRAIREHGGDLYQGVAHGLGLLRNLYPLFIVSNCQSGYIEMFLEFGKFTHLFADFECWGRTGQSKSHNLANVIRRNKLSSPVFIGDADGDRVAARACNIPFYFAEYGFGKVSDWDFSFENFSELVDKLGSVQIDMSSGVTG